MAHAMLQSIKLLADAAISFADRCVEGLEANEANIAASEWRNPHMLINYAYLSFQVFEAGQMTYEHGRIDQEGKGDFAGWPWHLVPVAPSVVY